MLACQTNSTDVVEFLLKNGANPNLDELGSIVLFFPPYPLYFYQLPIKIKKFGEKLVKAGGNLNGLLREISKERVDFMSDCFTS